MGLGKHFGRSVRRRSFNYLSSLPILDGVIYLHCVVSHSSSDRRTLHLCPDATWTFGKGRFSLVAKPLRSVRARFFRISAGVSPRELILRFSGVRRGAWSFWLPIGIILATSGLFEILESIVAEIMAPGKGVDWLGGQADVWDGQNDMLCALVGAFLMVTIVGLIEHKEAGR